METNKSHQIDGSDTSLETIVNEHVAISSLESPEHATKKDPGIISISWMLGKRCNYDCSYCAETSHDNYSSHIPKERIFDFADQLEKHTLNKGKKFKINITGGEPFVHPQFMDILEYLKSKDTLTQLVVCTNGSLPLDMYERSSRFITNLTVSLHMEQADQIANETVDKILALNKIKDWFLNVNLMALPGKFDMVKNIMKKFKENDVKFVLRKIIPPPGEVKKIEKSDKAKIARAEKTFNEDKRKFQLSNQESLQERQKNYYSQEEIDFFNQYENKKQWKNIRLHTTDSVVEKNTDELQARNLNSWKGWLCYVGVDSLYIQHNGTVFRGYCFAGNIIGELGKEIKWPEEPIICPFTWCNCNAVMPVRKVKENKYMNLIND